MIEVPVSYNRYLKKQLVSEGAEVEQVVLKNSGILLRPVHRRLASLERPVGHEVHPLDDWDASVSRALRRGDMHCARRPAAFVEPSESYSSRSIIVVRRISCKERTDERGAGALRVQITAASIFCCFVVVEQAKTIS